MLHTDTVMVEGFLATVAVGVDRQPYILQVQQYGSSAVPWQQFM